MDYKFYQRILESVVFFKKKIEILHRLGLVIHCMN